MKRLMKINISILLLASVVLLCCAFIPTMRRDSQNDLNKNDITDQDALENVPTEYKSVLQDYKKILKERFSDNFFVEYESGKKIALNEKTQRDLEKDVTYLNGEKQNLGVHFYNMIVEMDSLLEEKGTPEKFGYIIKDMNGDSIDELFWVDKNHNILAIFTIKDGQAELLDAFWPRYRAVLNDGGNLYIRSSGGAAHTNWEIKELVRHSTDFAWVEAFGIDGVDKLNNLPIYFHAVDNKREIIDAKMFDELLQKYPFEHSEGWLSIPIIFFE